MAPQQCGGVEPLGTLVAGKSLFPGVAQQMQFEVAGAGEVSTALLADALPPAALPF